MEINIRINNFYLRQKFCEGLLITGAILTRIKKMDGEQLESNFQKKNKQARNKRKSVIIMEQKWRKINTTQTNTISENILAN